MLLCVTPCCLEHVVFGILQIVVINCPEIDFFFSRDTRNTTLNLENQRALVTGPQLVDGVWPYSHQRCPDTTAQMPVRGTPFRASHGVAKPQVEWHLTLNGRRWLPG